MKEKQLSIVDHNLMDIVEHGNKEFPIQYYVDELYHYSKHMIPLHWHSDLEFYVAYGGDIQIQIGNIFVDLDEGNGIFINSNVLHSFQQKDSHQKCQCPNIVFSYELLSQTYTQIYKKYIQCIIMNSQLPYILFNQECSWQKDILFLLDHIFSLLQKYGDIPDYYGPYPFLPFENKDKISSCFEMEIQNALNHIWQIIYTHLSDIPKIPINQNKHILQIRIQKMIQFIHEHYASPILLSDIASAAHIGKSEASRCFQAYLKDSPIHYLLTFRIEKAKNALLYSHNTISQIAVSCGFQSSSYFCKVFHRETGYTPSQYKRIMTQRSCSR